MMLILFLMSVSSSYFLKLSPGVMSQGLGGSSIMIDEGLPAFHNPANIKYTKFNFTLSRWFYSTNIFSFGASLSEYCIGLSYLNYGSIQGFDEYGVKTNIFTPYNFCLALGRRFGLLGITIKTFGEKIDDYSLYGVCGGISTYIDLGNIAIGGKLDNLGKEFSESTTIPFVAAFGSKFTLPKNLDFFIELKIPDLELNFGLLYTYQNISILLGTKYFSTRFSKYTATFSDLQFTGGLLIQVENYEIGYSLVYTEFSIAHQFSITFIP